MASTTSSLLKLELQTTGENSGTWGTKSNSVISEAEKAIAGSTAITLASADVTLTDTDFSANQSRNLVLSLSGTLGASVSVIVPARTKAYMVVNACTQATAFTFTVTVKTASGTGIVVPAGGRPYWVYCDGTNVIAPQIALPHCAISEEVEVSLASTNNEVTLAFASGAIEADPYGMCNAGTNTITVPTNAELVQISCTAFFTASIPATTNVFLGIQQSSGSPGSSGGYPYEAIAHRPGSGSTYTPLTVSGMFHLPNNINQDRGRAFTVFGQLDVSTTGVAVSAFEISAVVLR